MIGSLLAHEQKNILHTLIQVLSTERLCSISSNPEKKLKEDARAVGGVAALVAALVEANRTLQSSLIDWLVSASASAPAQNHLSHRAVIVVVAQNKSKSDGLIPESS